MATPPGPPSAIPHVLHDILSGGVGAAALVAVGAPFDTLKVARQTSGAPLPRLVALVYAAGLPAFWRGALPAFASACTENVVLFASNGILRRALLPAGDTSRANGGSVPQIAFIGGCSGLFSAMAICPAETVKVRMQHALAAGRRVGAGAVLAEVLHTRGLRGLFAGLVPLIMRDVPFNFLFFGAQRWWFRVLGGGGEGDSSRLWTAALSGGLAGATAWVFVFPADTLKSLAQAEGGTRGLGETLRGVVAAGGVRSLWRGAGLAVGRALPANAALFAGVEAVERALA